MVLQPLTRNRLVDTAMLAHLGWFEDAPSFGEDAGQTTEIWFSVPARAPLALCLGTLTVAGCLHLTVRYPRRLFSADAARRFADCYLANIHRLAEVPRVGRAVRPPRRIESSPGCGESAAQRDPPPWRTTV